jgi:F-type H+-transporting ATPase subunit b
MHVELAQVLSQVVAFLITLAVLKRFAWKPLLQILEERRNNIQAELDAIQEQRDALVILEAEYNERVQGLETLARTKIQEAIHDAQKIAREIQQRARDQAQELVEKTRSDLEQELVKARMQLKNDVVHLTMLATEKLTHGAMNAAMQEKMLIEFIENLELK